MRALLLLAALTACEGQDAAEAPNALAISCTPDGAAPGQCGVTRASVDGNTVLTVTEPDGGFRRLAVDAEGKVATADGAIAATVAPASDGTLEVTVEDDRYRLPAR